MIRVVIVDDEIRSRETLQEMIKIYCSKVEVVGEGEDVKSGIKAIKAYNPDLVFLDIKMPDGSGFDLLRQMMPVTFKLIFITAYEEYAIKAFKFNAIDYITKPIDPEELQTALQKAESALEADNLNSRLTGLLDMYLKPQAAESKKVILKTADAIHILDAEDIIRCESDRNYTRFYLKSGEELLISKSIKEFVEYLEERNFMRVHQSHLINLNYLIKFKKDDLICVLRDSTEVPVAWRKKDELLKIFKSL
ncbi:MAG: LytTR family DNA-binding domain-containing protein [Lentimicrobium sp.]|nr:LytTR family DNA-binding domain-containing protein [Lentimicrobium sp.]